MQDLRGYQPSTVSRRLSVISGFYRTCVIDGTLENSPEFEAMLTAARDSAQRDDFALEAMLGLFGHASPAKSREVMMTGLLIGYARVSTEEQDLTAQRDGLAALGVEPSRTYLTMD
jgi:hypothetical protein